MAIQIEDEQKDTIEPTTEFDHLTDIKGVSEDDRSKWMGITNLLYRVARRTGYDEGLKAGREEYSLSYRAWFNTGTFISGLALGMTFGSFVLILLFKFSGVLVIGG